MAFPGAAIDNALTLTGVPSIVNQVVQFEQSLAPASVKNELKWNSD